MSHAVLQLSATDLEKMKTHYAKHIQAKLPTGAVFMAKPPGCTITGYRSGKVLFQGTTASAEAFKWKKQGKQTTGSPKQKTTKKPTHQYAPPPNVHELSLIGSDEVGTGDFFGPITVVAAYVRKQDFQLMKELGVKDSKHLNDKQIVAIAKNLIDSIPYSLLILRNEKYNELQKSGMTQGKMKAILHNRALANTISKINGEHEGVLVDQFAEPSTYFQHIKAEKQPVTTNIFFSTKAESVHLSVAAASIIARYAFIKEFEKMSATAGVELPKGAGAHVDEAAAKIINKHGVAKLESLTKVHFANTAKAKKIAARL